jgi:TPR repeat protein
MRALVLAVLVASPAMAAEGAAEALAQWRRGDAAGAYARLRALSVQGVAEADALLGFMTLRGAGTRADPAVAAGWWTRAARRGDPAAQLALADAYARGRGVPVDRARALELAQRAAAQEQPGAAILLARLREAYR